MAWWPFGKKKGSEAAEEAAPDPAATPEGEADGAPTIPPGHPNLDAPAPTILVPPEFAQQGDQAPFSSEMPTLSPQQMPVPVAGGDPFGADPFGGGGDPFAQPQAGAPDDFARTMEDPDSPKVKKRPPPVRGGPPPAPIQQADPFAAPPRRNDFAQTLSDPEDNDRTLPPSFAMSPGGTGGPQPPPVDMFASAEPHEQTMKMPGPPVQGRPRAGAPSAAKHNAPPTPGGHVAEDVTYTAPAPAHPPTQPASVAQEETPMLAKTALSPDKIRLGRALLAGGPITQERLMQELDKSGKSQSVLGKALLKSNFPKEEELLAALVASIRIPKINVRNTKIPLETIRVVPVDVARRWKLLPIERIGDILVIVSPGLGDEEALGAVRKATGCSVFPFQCDAEGFDDVLDGYYDRLAASGLAPSPAAAEAFAPAPHSQQPAGRSHAAPAPAAGPTGPVPALPADDGHDDWDRIYAAAGPLPAEEVLL